MISVRFSASMLISLILTACSASSAPQISTPPSPKQSKAALSSRFVIDGIADFSVFDQIMNQMVQIRGNLGTGAQVRNIKVEWGVLNDDRDIYLAVRWSDPTHNNKLSQNPINIDIIKLILDSNKSGIVDDNDDEHVIAASGSSSYYLDQYFLGGSDVDDEIGDGQARLKYNSNTFEYVAEFLFPRTNDKNGQDGILDATTPFNLIFIDNLQLPAIKGNLGTLFPSLEDTTAWSTFNITTGDIFQYADIPSGLTGLIAFISDHEAGSNGDIYTFDPATGKVNRLTNLPNFFKDNISLSHDRTRIAFHGAANSSAFDQYEIDTHTT